MLEQLTCEQSPGGLRRLLRVAPAQQPLLQTYRALACNGSRAARRERFAQLATELREQLDTPRIVSRVRAGLRDMPPTSVGWAVGQGQGQVLGRVSLPTGDVWGWRALLHGTVPPDHPLTPHGHLC